MDGIIVVQEITLQNVYDLLKKKFRWQDVVNVIRYLLKEQNLAVEPSDKIAVMATNACNTMLEKGWALSEDESHYLKVPSSD